MVYHNSLNQSFPEAWDFTKGGFFKSRLLCLFICKPQLSGPKTIGPVIIFCGRIYLVYTACPRETVMKFRNVISNPGNHMIQRMVRFLYGNRLICFKCFLCLHNNNGPFLILHIRFVLDEVKMKTTKYHLPLTAWSEPVLFRHKSRFPEAHTCC